MECADLPTTVGKKFVCSNATLSYLVDVIRRFCFSKDFRTHAIFKLAPNSSLTSQVVWLAGRGLGGSVGANSDNHSALPTPQRGNIAGPRAHSSSYRCRRSFRIAGADARLLHRKTTDGSSTVSGATPFKQGFLRTVSARQNLGRSQQFHSNQRHQARSVRGACLNPVSIAMRMSARNQIRGTLIEVKKGATTSHVRVA
jgi:hypothetical protein